MKKLALGLLLASLGGMDLFGAGITDYKKRYLLSVINQPGTDGLVEWLAQQRLYLNHQLSPRGETMLHRAVRRRCLRTVSILLRQPGIDPNAPDYAGNTPLHYALWYTITHWRLAEDGMEIMLALIQAGARLNLPNTRGQTPCTFVDAFLAGGDRERVQEVLWKKRPAEAPAHWQQASLNRRRGDASLEELRWEAWYRRYYQQAPWPTVKRYSYSEEDLAELVPALGAVAVEHFYEKENSGN